MKSHTNLTNPTQKIQVQNDSSNIFGITTGVHQNNTPSPFLVLIFVTDLPGSAANLDPLIFSDDSNFFCIDVQTEIVQVDLDSFFIRTQKNKSQRINLIRTRAHTSPWEIARNRYGLGKMFLNQHESNPTSVSSDLKWNLHIENACLKANRVFHLIRRNVSDLSKRGKLNLYKSMLVAVLMYAFPCFGLSKNIIGELENIQNRVVKWIDSGETIIEKTSVDITSVFLYSTEQPVIFI